MKYILLLFIEKKNVYNIRKNYIVYFIFYKIYCCFFNDICLSF